MCPKEQNYDLQHVTLNVYHGVLFKGHIKYISWHCVVIETRVTAVTRGIGLVLTVVRTKCDNSNALIFISPNDIVV